MKLTSCFSLVLGFLAIGMDAGSATLKVSDGELMGASAVIVEGRTYNVEFLDGTCIERFNGCDDPSDFVFQNQASATFAASALLEQVLLDSPLGLFDSTPTLINGCTPAPAFNLCVIATPFYVGPTHVFTMKAYNWNGVFNDALEMNAYEPNNNFEDAYTTWARWTIPETGTLALFGLGLISLARSARK